MTFILMLIFLRFIRAVIRGRVESYVRNKLDYAIYVLIFRPLLSVAKLLLRRPVSKYQVAYFL